MAVGKGIASRSPVWSSRASSFDHQSQSLLQPAMQSREWINCLGSCDWFLIAALGFLAKECPFYVLIVFVAFFTFFFKSCKLCIWTWVFNRIKSIKWPMSILWIPEMKSSQPLTSVSCFFCCWKNLNRKESSKELFDYAAPNVFFRTGITWWWFECASPKWLFINFNLICHCRRFLQTCEWISRGSPRKGHWKREFRNAPFEPPSS